MHKFLRRKKYLKNKKHALIAVVNLGRKVKNYQWD